MNDVEITELVKIDADRVDGVGSPASGIPILLMKAIAEPAADLPDEPAVEPEPDRAAAKALAREILGSLPDVAKAVGKRGQVDEAPDVDLGNQIIALLFRAIIAEAQEGAAGNAGEVCDIQELACALQAVRCWRDGEQAVSLGDVMPASMLMQSAAESPAESAIKAATLGIISLNDAAGIILKGGPSAEERRQAASEGNALPDGSYPIRNAHELHSAAVLARSGHGDVAAAKRLIARRAKELGVANPLDSDGDTSKSQLAEQETAVDTVTQNDDGGQIAKAVEDAVTKALAASEERYKALEAELAKVKALPVPGGPMMTAVIPRKAQDDGEDHAAKAAKYDLLAEQLADQGVADEYRKLAARHRAQITV